MVDDLYDSNNDFEHHDFDSFRGTSIVNNSERGIGNNTRSNRRDVGRSLGNDDESRLFLVP